MGNKYSHPALVIGIILLVCTLGRASDDSITDIEPVGLQGTVSFILHTDRPYLNGHTDSVVQQMLFNLPGLGNCVFRRNYEDVRIHFRWENAESHAGFQLTPSELPGPAKYSIILTWDAEQGLSDGYFQGVPFRTEAPDNFTPWKLAAIATCVELGEGPIQVTDVQVAPVYSSPNEISRLVPRDLVGSGAKILWQQDLSSDVDIERRKGRLLYSSESDNGMPFESWIMEGPGALSQEDGSTVVRSLIPDPPDGSTGHLNFWCPDEFPENFIAEWEFKPVSEYGLTGVFFAARGANGEDLFDSALAERDGHYPQYHSGDIQNYFLFYYTNRLVNRTTDYSTSWLLKAHGVSNLAKGPIGIKPRVYEFSHVRLIKDSGHIRFIVNDRITLDFTDPGDDRWGPVLGGGKVGFRQMARTVAAYRNFKVWELPAE